LFVGRQKPGCKKIVALVEPISSKDSTAMGRLFQPLLFLLTRSTEHEPRRKIEFLKAENEMLRKRVAEETSMR
jgi:hypothetical protein